MIINELWQDFLKIINEEVGSRVVETWFKALVFTRWDSQTQTVYLTVPNRFVQEWITCNYQSLLTTHLSRLINSPIAKVIYIQSNGENQITPAVKLSENTAILKVKNGSGQSLSSVSSKVPVSYRQHSVIKGNVNPNYQFSTFISGPTNSLAYAAAQAVGDKPGVLYNPLFIYGNSGLGKTHLLHAVGNWIKENKQGMKILYQTADRFIGEFINAIRFDKVAEFEKLYKEIDVLLVDDIQFISNKEQTQEIFFHIFNTLYERKKQIVFTSDSLPKDIQGLADRLRSRLDGGLVTDIQAPTFETKIAILKKKAEIHDELLPDDVAHYLASQYVNNIRQLEGLLIRLYAHASLSKQKITLQLAQEICTAHVKFQAKPTIDLQKIACKVAHHFNFTLTELKSNKRHKHIALARHIAMYFMKKYTDSSLTDIANFFKKRDHSTVIYAIEKIENHKQKNPGLLKEITSIDNKLTLISR